ncbi:putative hydrolase of the HAD superfamily [Diaminobutyricimonas aerilata]|uniref:Putative hydrolase of the HAD superfamily n=1 Tax=Diaminobutyricimonas aerilata TaxID=1162967 RepID=A0A2M9CGW3_9MICO|nr:HAD family hydrolase [Diaminobutyricimonas aerilata]PJJ71163.1 putative hydrolase of the HAD superfamily [Diaminobutyricimonas aerilata]
MAGRHAAEEPPGTSTPEFPAAVLFDLDDTLFAHRAAVESGVLAHRTSLGGELAAADAAVEFARWTDLEEHHYHRYLSGEVGFLEQRRERARGFVAPYGIDLDDDAADAWFDGYLAGYRAAWSLHDDALPCLDELGRRRPGVRFGIITNGELDFQTEKLDAVALSERVDSVVASGAVGIAKPDPRIFRLACELLAVRPEHAVYVGDRLHTDAIGAASAGLTGVWIDRRGTATDADLAEAATAGAHVIRSLDELPELLLPA